MKKELSLKNGVRNILVNCTLYCNQRCPHCYLTNEEKSSKSKMSLEDFEKICINIKNYYEEQNNPKNEIIFSWYGGEITLLPPEYFLKAKEITDKIYSDKNRYKINHYFTTNLISGINEDNILEWVNVFKTLNGGQVSTSCDYLMRGKNYLKKWKLIVKKLKFHGIKIVIITVYNKTLLNKEQELLDIYQELDIDGITFLPLYKTDSNVKRDNYEDYKMDMLEYSDFLINIHKLAFKNFYKVNFNSGVLFEVIKKYQLNKDKKNLMQGFDPEIEIHYTGDIILNYQINENRKPGDPLGNKYKSPKESMYIGNILKDSFKEIINHKNFSKVINHFSNYNGNQCNNCPVYSYCLLNERKDIYMDDSGECMGSKKFVSWCLDFYNSLNFLQKKVFLEEYIKNIEDNYGDVL